MSLHAGWAPHQSAPGGQIADESVQLTIGAGVERLAQPVVELLDTKAPLVRGLPQASDNLFPVGVRRPHVTPVISHPTTIRTFGVGAEPFPGETVQHEPAAAASVR
jgi:hypothetical protein